MHAGSIGRTSRFSTSFLAIEDVTDRVTLSATTLVAHERLDMLNQELTHRVKNSLQSIAAMVMIESRYHDGPKGQSGA